MLDICWVVRVFRRWSCRSSSAILKSELIETRYDHVFVHLSIEAGSIDLDVEYLLYI